jgi:hypothetical protein
MNIHEQYIIDKCVENDPSIMEFVVRRRLCKIHGTIDNIDKCKCVQKPRDIYLHDILGAIEKRAETLGWIKVMEKFNEIMDLDEWGNHSLYYAVIENWNLKKPLHEQSDETKLLLARILGFKE